MKKVKFYAQWAVNFIKVLANLPKIIRIIKKQQRQEQAMRDLALAIERSGAIKINGKPWYGSTK